MTSDLSNGPTLYLLESKAVAYAREAGRILQSCHSLPSDVVYKSKGMRDPVTKLDAELELLLRSSIARDFPGHAILGEEGTGVEAESSEYCWVLDPIDGTTNFVNGLPWFAVSIGVLHRQVPVVGAIFSNQTHLGTAGVYHAARGRGAWLEGVPLKILDENEPNPVRITAAPGSYGRFEMDRELRRKHGETRVLGSVAVEMAMTSAGVFQFAVFGAPKIWDVAAGVVIVRESGGDVMVGTGDLSVWERFETFAAASSVEEVRTDLRRWSRSLVIGPPGVVSYVARHLRPRAKRGARGRPGSSQAGEKPDSL